MDKKIIIAVLLIALFWVFERTEICVGQVLNSDGDGISFFDEEPYNYIAYSSKYKDGDIVLTYLLKNPLNTYCDDYIIRKDFKIR